MFNYRWLIPAVALLSVVYAARADTSMAQKWGPEAATAVIASTGPSIEIGSKVVECGEIAGEGKIEHSSKWTFTPTFIECTSNVKAEGAWTAVAEGTEEAALTIPSGEANRVVIEISSKCSVFMEAGGTLRASKDIYNGTNGTTDPSVFVFTATEAPQEVPVVDSPSGCLNSASQAVIKANFELLNMTSGSQPIADEGEFSDNFKSANSKGESKGKSSEAPIKNLFIAGGATIECAGAKASKEGGVAETIYKIRKAEKGQGEVTQGGHLVGTIESWGTCTSTATGSKGVTVKAGKCQLGIAGEREKELEHGKGLGSVITECAFEFEGCVIKVGPQEGLKSEAYEDSGKALSVKQTLLNMSDTVNAMCELFGVKKSTIATLKGEMTDPETSTV